MSRATFARLLEEEIRKLNLIVEALKDRSRLCFPQKYDCSNSLKEVILSLKRLQKKARQIEQF